MVENSFSLSDSSVIEIGFIQWMWLENVVLLIGMDCKTPNTFEEISKENDYWDIYQKLNFEYAFFKMHFYS